MNKITYYIYVFFYRFVLGLKKGTKVTDAENIDYIFDHFNPYNTSKKIGLILYRRIGQEKILSIARRFIPNIKFKKTFKEFIMILPFIGLILATLKGSNLLNSALFNIYQLYSSIFIFLIILMLHFNY